jgi:hypothetical protein
MRHLLAIINKKGYNPSPPGHQVRTISEASIAGAIKDEVRTGEAANGSR